MGPWHRASISPAASPASCWEEGDPENGSRALSLKAALAGEIMGANEVGVKRAEARPSLRSQFRMGRRRTPVSRRAMWRNNRLRPGHGGAKARRGRALAVRTSEGNGTAAAPCSATKSVSSIICATRPFGTGRSPRVHLEPSLGSTPSKYESRYGVRPARSSRSRSSSGDMDRVLPREGAARRSAIEARTDRQIVCGDDRSHASGSDSLIVTQARLGGFWRALREGSVIGVPQIHCRRRWPLAGILEPA